MPHKILDAPCTSQVTCLLLQPGSRVESIRWHLAGTMASLEEAARAFQPDILISVYYRKIIPQAILDIPPKVTYPNGSASGLRTRPHADACALHVSRICTHRSRAALAARNQNGCVDRPANRTQHTAMLAASGRVSQRRQFASRTPKRRAHTSPCECLTDAYRFNRSLLLVFWVRVRGTFTRRCCRGTEAASPTFGRS